MKTNQADGNKRCRELRKELKIDARSIIKHNYDYLGYNWKIR